MSYEHKYIFLQNIRCKIFRKTKNTQSKNADNFGSKLKVRQVCETPS